MNIERLEKNLSQHGEDHNFNKIAKKLIDYHRKKKIDGSKYKFPPEVFEVL